MVIYTDGSAHPNPGPGGFGVIIVDDNEEHILDLYEKQFEYTTNNEQELKAILYTMIKYGKENPLVYSDSAYAVNSLTKWMFRWAKDGWLKKDKKPPENLELIQTYYNLYQEGYRINLQLIKGHNNNKWNDAADLLATGQYKIIR